MRDSSDGERLKRLLAAVQDERDNAVCDLEYAKQDRSILADEVRRLRGELAIASAVCLCGCPDDEHEADDCGESCGHDDHECIRVSPAVRDIVVGLRAARRRTLCAYCGTISEIPEGKTWHEVAVDHIMGCDKHPLKRIAEEAERLELAGGEGA